MRKLKQEIQYRVPSWNFCNHDGYTSNNRYSKDLCRFCVKTKGGHRCVLHDMDLAEDPQFVHKTPLCVKATAGFAVSLDEVPPQQSTSPIVDPKLIIRESIKEYNKTTRALVAQGYPQAIAETVALKHLLNE